MCGLAVLIGVKRLSEFDNTNFELHVAMVLWNEYPCSTTSKLNFQNTRRCHIEHFWNGDEGSAEFQDKIQRVKLSFQALSDFNLYQNTWI